MTPFFSPEPHEYHRIPVFVAGVNRRICQLIEEEVAEAVLIHHKGSDNAVGSLAAIIDMADYLCAQADLGFFSELPNPGAEMISASGCEDEAALAQLVQEVRDAFQEESFLFKEA
jgi:hypothetical protein